MAGICPRHNNKKMKKVYMVEFGLPPVFTEEIMALIPRQRHYINELLLEGTVQSYSLADDRSRLWAVMSAESELDLLDIIGRFPMADFMDARIDELMFHNAADALMQFSLN